ncbi:MAG: hypothetical protein ACREBR_05365 [bacterium]
MNWHKRLKYQENWKKLHPLKAKQYINKYMRSPFGRFSQSRYRAKKRGIVFKLTLEQFSQLITKPCFYCGCEPNSNLTGFWLDRIDNNVGYVLKNVVPCCKICNVMKNNLGFKEFKNHIMKIVRNLA